VGGAANVFGRFLYEHTVVVWTHGDLVTHRCYSGSAAKMSHLQRVFFSQLFAEWCPFDFSGGLQGYLAGAGHAPQAFLADIAGGCVVMDNSGLVDFGAAHDASALHRKPLAACSLAGGHRGRGG
jgi:hypothetical protein